MKINELTKKQAVETLKRIDRWSRAYENTQPGDARFRIKVEDILMDIEESPKPKTGSPQ